MLLHVLYAYLIANKLATPCGDKKSQTRFLFDFFRKTFEWFPNVFLIVIENDFVTTKTTTKPKSDAKTVQNDANKTQNESKNQNRNFWKNMFFELFYDALETLRHNRALHTSPRWYKK